MKPTTTPGDDEAPRLRMRVKTGFPLTLQMSSATMKSCVCLSVAVLRHDDQLHRGAEQEDPHRGRPVAVRGDVRPEGGHKRYALATILD